MALTPSTMLPLGTTAPDFNLPEPLTGKTVGLNTVATKAGWVIMFLSNHCPYVKHLTQGLAQFGSEYQAKGFGIVGICANDITTHPDDSPSRMAQEARQHGYTFPYLYDETQQVAQAYHAACTPDFFLFDADRRLVYRGQFDASRPGNNIPVTGADLRAACDALLRGEKPSETQLPSIGCNIKWKSGNAPAYFA
jgi:peroxiredoxin